MANSDGVAPFSRQREARAWSHTHAGNPPAWLIEAQNKDFFCRRYGWTYREYHEADMHELMEMEWVIGLEHGGTEASDTPLNEDAQQILDLSKLTQPMESPGAE